VVIEVVNVVGGGGLWQDGPSPLRPWANVALLRGKQKRQTVSLGTDRTKRTKRFQPISALSISIRQLLMLTVENVMTTRKPRKATKEAAAQA
jgi:hypothetical protein